MEQALDRVKNRLSFTDDETKQIMSAVMGDEGFAARLVTVSKVYSEETEKNNSELAGILRDFLKNRTQQALPTAAPTLAKEVQIALQPQFTFFNYLGSGHCIAFSALDNETKSDVAIKVSPLDDASQAFQEKRILSEILKECEGIPRIIKSMQTTDFFMLVEERVGKPLDIYEGVSVPLLLKLAPKLIDILVGIHAKNIVHCDIKPSNIIITPNKDPVIIDFGLSVNWKKNQQIGFEGTEDFASASKVRGKLPTPRDDFVSLCYSFYALEIGLDKWYCFIDTGQKKPSISNLETRSKVIHTLCELWRNRNKKRKVQSVLRTQHKKRVSQYHFVTLHHSIQKHLLGLAGGLFLRRRRLKLEIPQFDRLDQLVLFC